MPTACIDESLARRLARGGLEPAQRASLEEHLASCEACRLLADQARRDWEVRADAPTFRQGTVPASWPAGDEPQAGTPIGRYLLLALLGSGSTGEIWSAYDPKLERKVALKLMRPRQGPGTDGPARLLAEAQAMARLSHPNVLPVYDVGTWRERVFLAEELGDAGDLHDWLNAKQRSWREVLQAFLAAGRGLGAAHAAGLVHCDFKPANVVLTRAGAVRVADFGLAGHAALVERRACAGDFEGTVGYVAPEVMLGRPHSVLSDQFSFCVSVWQGLFGRLPFPSDTPLEVVEAAQRAPVPRERGKVPLRVVRALQRGLSKDPAQRFPGLEELLRELSRDPARTARRAAVPLALVAVACVLGAFVFRAQQEATRCEREQRAADEAAWSAQGRARTAEALRGAGLAPGEVGRVLALLDERFGELGRDAAASCERARRDSRWQAALRCVEQARQRQAAVVGMLSRPGYGTSMAVGALLNYLTPPLTCVDQQEQVLRRESLQPSERIRAMTAELGTLYAFTDYQGVVRLAPGYVAQAREAGALRDVAQMSGDLALATWAIEGPKAVVPLVRAAIRAADASGEDDISFAGRLTLASIYSLGLSRFEEAEAALADAEAWLTRAGHPVFAEAQFLMTRGDVLSLMGRSEEALAAYLDLVARAPAAYGARSVWVVHAHMRVGDQLSRMGRRAQAEGAYQQASQAMERVVYATPEDRAILWGNWAYLLAEQGRLDEARELAAKGRAALEPDRKNQQRLLAWYSIVDGLLRELDGDFAGADAAYEQMLSQREILDAAWAADGLAGRARSLARKGAGEQAVAAAKESLALLEPEDSPYVLSWARFSLAQAHWAAGQEDEARRAGRLALDGFTQGEPGLLGRVARGWLRERGLSE